MKNILVILCLLPLVAAAQIKEFTLVTYNSLRYSPDNIDDRHPHFRLIMSDLNPDVLVLEELSGSNSAAMFMDSVLNADSTTYNMASFINGNDLDIALYFKMAKFSSLATQSYPTALRDIYHFRLIPSGSIDTLHVFGVHLKASSGSSNANTRAAEAAVLRNVTDQFPDGSHFLVCGDFNVYSSSEPAYQALLNDTPDNEGHFVDKINMPGTWNNAVYAPYHTQSPRTTQFNGGANGGMDDRFDLILISEALNGPDGITYKPGSMYAYGNDGQHYNQAIIDQPVNTAVGPVLAQALHQASDHLPVAASFTYSVYHAGGTGEGVEEKKAYIAYTGGEVWLRNPEGRSLTATVFTLSGQRIREIHTSGHCSLDLRPGFYLVVVRDKVTSQPLLTEKLVK